MFETKPNYIAVIACMLAIGSSGCTRMESPKSVPPAKSGSAATRYARHAIAACCFVDLPVGAVDTTGTPIDSMAARTYRFGTTTISYDLTARTGLPSPSATQLAYDRAVEGVDGFVNNLATAVKTSRGNAALSVTVICLERGCVIAHDVLTSVEVNGAKVM